MGLGHVGQRGMLELHKRNLLKGVKKCKLDFCQYCVYGKQHRVNSRQTLIQVRVFLTTFIKMFGAQYEFLLIAMLSTSPISLMTTVERYGFIL